MRERINVKPSYFKKTSKEINIHRRHLALSSNEQVLSRRIKFMMMNTINMLENYSSISFLLKTLGILIIYLSLYLEGGLTANTEWVVKMKQVQQDINNIETKSGKIVVKVSTDYAEQVQNIHDIFYF